MMRLSVLQGAMFKNIMKSLTVLCLAFVSLLTSPAKAATLTSTFQFTASGTIGTQGFTNARITLTTVGDTGNRQTLDGAIPNQVYSISNNSVTISISGVGTFQFTTPAQTFLQVSNDSFSDNLPPGTVNSGEAYITFGVNGGAMVRIVAYPLGLPWDMFSSFNPLNPLAVPKCLSGWNSTPIVTTGGTVNLYDDPTCWDYGNGATFQTVVTPTVAVAPAQLSLSYQLGSVLPVGVLQVSGLGSGGVFTVTASNWLSVNPTSGTTPAVGTSPVTVNVNTNGLVAGTYSGAISVTQNAATVIVPVNLTVTAPFVPSIYDVNGDGVVNVVDVQLVINAALGIISPSAGKMN